MTKIAVLGASGQIGQPLSLLLKSVRVTLPPIIPGQLLIIVLQSPLVTELRLYDVAHAIGVATGLNHIDTPAKVSGCLPADNGLEKTLTGAETVIIPAGIARKPGMTHDGAQFGGDEIVKSKAGAGSATTCMAYAGFRFAQAIMKASKGESGIVEPTYIYLPGVPGGEKIAKELGVDYFDESVEFGAEGANKVFDIGKIVNV